MMYPQATSHGVRAFWRCANLGRIASKSVDSLLTYRWLDAALFALLFALLVETEHIDVYATRIQPNVERQVSRFSFGCL